MIARRREPGPQPPDVGPVALADLSPADSAPEPGDLREQESFADLDLSGRDLEHSTFTACSLARVALHDARLRGVHLAECVLTELDVPALAAPRSSWRDVDVAGSRLGSAELYESTWRSVTVRGSKLGYLNARAATWTDVLVADCTLEELDLAYASVQRLRFERCRIGTLDVSQASLADVDLRGAELSVVRGLTGLRGAWITQPQLADLAPALAAELGIQLV